MSFNILIVDDSNVIRSMIRRTIDMAGVPVGALLDAGNGQEALEVLSDNWVDLMMADINMPVMDGEALIRRMREDEILKSIPVVVVSAERNAEKLERLTEWGVHAVVHKPFTPEKIRNVIQDVLGEWEETGDDTGTDDTF